MQGMAKTDPYHRILLAKAVLNILVPGIVEVADSEETTPWNKANNDKMKFMLAKGKFKTSVPECASSGPVSSDVASAPREP